MKYVYTSENLIANPITYEFSKYFGMEGLLGYENDRNTVMASIFKKTTQCSNVITAVKNILPLNNSPTEILFAKIFLEIIQGNLSKKSEEIIFIFIKKFEVSKRIWNEYDESTCKKIGNDYSKPLPYLLFANILVEYIILAETIEKKMIVFNVILKICDTITSIQERLMTDVEISLAASAFLKEREIYLKFKNGEVIK